MPDNKDKITENKKDFLFEDIRKIKALITSVFKLKCIILKYDFYIIEKMQENWLHKG